jgi:hypothetical protein
MIGSLGCDRQIIRRFGDCLPIGKDSRLRRAVPGWGQVGVGFRWVQGIASTWLNVGAGKS